MPTAIATSLVLGGGPGALVATALGLGAGAGFVAGACLLFLFLWAALLRTRDSRLAHEPPPKPADGDRPPQTIASAEQAS